MCVSCLQIGKWLVMRTCCRVSWSTRAIDADTCESESN